MHHEEGNRIAFRKFTAIRSCGSTTQPAEIFPRYWCYRNLAGRRVRYLVVLTRENEGLAHHTLQAQSWGRSKQGYTNLRPVPTCNERMCSSLDCPKCDDSRQNKVPGGSNDRRLGREVLGFEGGAYCASRREQINPVKEQSSAQKIG